MDWALWQRAAGLSERTITERASCVRTLGETATHEAITMTRQDVLRYLGRRTLSPSSRATYYSTLRVFFRWLVEAGYREDNPMDGMPSPRRPRGVPKPVAAANLEAFLGVLNRRKTRAMAFLALYAGLRVHEIAKVRGEHVDLEARTLVVTGKGSKTAVLPVHRELLELARSMPRHGWWFPANEGVDAPITPHAVSRALVRAMKRAGFEGHAHQLRHWFGSELVARGVDLRTVQELLRHEHLSTTQIYTQVPDGAKRAGVDLLAA